MRQKGFVFLPVIVIVGLIGVVGYLIFQNTQLKKGEKISETTMGSVQPTTIPSEAPTSMDELSTYNNSKNYYTISYPSKWQVHDYKGVILDIPGEVAFTPPDEASTPFTYRTKIMIVMATLEESRFDLNSQEEFDEWLTKPISNGEGERLYKISNPIVDGNKGVGYISRTLPGDGPSYYNNMVWVQRNGSNYYFWLFGDESKVNRNISTFNTMLQSVSFTN